MGSLISSWRRVREEAKSEGTKNLFERNKVNKWKDDYKFETDEITQGLHEAKITVKLWKLVDVETIAVKSEVQMGVEIATPEEKEENIEELMK